MKLYQESVSFKWSGTPSRLSREADRIEIDGVVYCKTSFGDLQKVGGPFGAEWHESREDAKRSCVEHLKRVAEEIQAEITKLEATA